MNIHKPTGKKISSWPQMVVRLTKERDELKRDYKALSEENMDLKRRCCDLWKEVMEEKAKNCK